MQEHMGVVLPRGAARPQVEGGLSGGWRGVAIAQVSPLLIPSVMLV